MEIMSSSFSPLLPNNKPLKRAVFLDRDGTLNVEKKYLIDPAEFEFIPGVQFALKRLRNAGFLLVVVTNQSGVARGRFGLDDVAKLHEHIRRLLREYSVVIDRFEICPHHPKQGTGEYLVDCDCRKGKPGMLLKAAQDLQIDLTRSFMVGDKLSDIEAGESAGCTSYLVLTGYGKGYQHKVGQHTRIFHDLPAVVEDIIKREKG